MKLVDGQVMDYTKDVPTPYRDPRADQVQPMEATAKPVEPVPLPSLTSDRTVLTTNPDLSQQQGAGWANPNVEPIYPPRELSPGLHRFQPVLPETPVPPLPQESDKLSELFGKVQARKEALESLEDTTPEMKATIKAYDWVLEQITKSRMWCEVQ